MNNNLDNAVAELHNVARTVEREIGTGQLSEDIRKCAERLNDLLKKVPYVKAD
jgi:hypothetical protein